MVYSLIFGYTCSSLFRSIFRYTFAGGCDGFSGEKRFFATFLIISVFGFSFPGGVEGFLREEKRFSASFERMTQPNSWCLKNIFSLERTKNSKNINRSLECSRVRQFCSALLTEIPPNVPCENDTAMRKNDTPWRGFAHRTVSRQTPALPFRCCHWLLRAN